MVASLSLSLERATIIKQEVAQCQHYDTVPSTENLYWSDEWHIAGHRSADSLRNATAAQTAKIPGPVQC